jgi:phenylalanyl-tRNA synthetase beta subunit
MSDNYFSEVKNYNTISEENLVKFNVFNYKENVKVVSANNINRQYLRNNSIYSMLMNYKKNVSYKNDLLPIYEIQKIYQNKKPGIKNISFITPEVYYLDRTTGAKIVYNINGLIGLVNEVASLFNATLTYKRATSPYFYDNECVSVNYKNKVVGYIGAIKNSLLKECGIQNEKIYACALN